MSVSELLKKRLADLDISLYGLHKRTGYEVSFPYLQRIFRDEIKQVSVKKLRTLAKAFGDPIHTWMNAAGYLDEDTGDALKSKYGDLLDDERLESIVKRLKNLSPENQAQFFKMVDLILKGME